MTEALTQIPLSEFRKRRKKLAKALKKSLAVVFAGDYAPQLSEAFRPHPHFEYLTGLTDEYGAVLVLDPSCPDPLCRELLFLRPRNPESESWDGWRSSIGAELRRQTGIHSIHRTNQLSGSLNGPARRTKSLSCLHPLASPDSPVSPDLALFKRIAERVPGTEIIDRSELLAEMRAVKSANELRLIRRAVEISAQGYDALMRAMRPGMTEFELQEILEHTCRSKGARGQMFRTIMGAGRNSTVLHYVDNDHIVQDGDLVCVDSGARVGSGACGYGADITRTLPANGRFSKRQRLVYEVVLAAQNAAIRMIEPGVAFAALDKAARDVVERAGFGDYFIHGIGHHIGLEVHDITPFGPLTAGSVITVEPGIYIPEEQIGVRIEDDVLVTNKGQQVLSAQIPKTVEEIEAVMKGDG